MSRRIEKAAVLGAGVMGATIAAHLANVGIPTCLLDIVPFELGEEEKKKGWDESTPAFRNKLGNLGLGAALKAKPAAFYLKDDAELITVGNFEDNLEWLAECDLVVEVVVERLDIKRSLFERIIPHLKEGAIVASNTSGLPIKDMSEGLDEGFQKNFIGTHFFNPPRFMKLLEIIPGPKTDPETVSFMTDFCEKVLGKDAVLCADRPNFVANRIGTFAVMHLFHNLAETGLSIEEIDALTGSVIGHRMATFRTMDLVGLDVLIHTASNVYDGCPRGRNAGHVQAARVPHQDAGEEAPGQQDQGRVLQEGQGRGGQEGHLRPGPGNFGVPPLGDQAQAGHPGPRSSSFPSCRQKIKALAWGKDKAGRFTWDSLAHTLIYAANRLGEITEDRGQAWTRPCAPASPGGWGPLSSGTRWA